jgi:hypothetical protein
MLTIKAGNYTRRAELVGGTDSTAQINGNGNTGVDGVGAVSNITTNTTSTNNGDTEVAIEVEVSDPTDPYFWPSWDVFSPTQIEEMLNGMFSAPNETGNTLEGGGVSDGQGDDEFGNDGQFRFDDPDDPGLGSQQHLRAGKMAPNMGLNATERHLFALHGAGQMQSIFANSIPGVGVALGAVDGANGEDSITGEKLTYFQRGLGLLGAVPFVGGMVKSTGRVAKTTRAVDKVAETIGHAPVEGPLYRGLAAGENAAAGLKARAPGVGNSVASHVAGKRQSQWISLTKDENIAAGKFGQNGYVKVDPSKLDPDSIVDISEGIPGMPGIMLSHWARKMREVLVRDHIPPDAISP